MTGFWQEAWFFTWELFKFTTLFYVVWVPGFFVAGFLACRYRYQAWNRVTLEPKPSLKGFIPATGLGIIGSAGRKASLSGMGNCHISVPCFHLPDRKPQHDHLFLGHLCPFVRG